MNQAGSYGGGVSDSSGAIVNNIIDGNRSYDCGGGLWECTGELLNNSIVGNRTDNNGHGLVGCTGTIRNCIVWGAAGIDAGNLVVGCSEPSFCCIEGWIDDEHGNIGPSSCFSAVGTWVDNGTPSNFRDDTWMPGDYHLVSGSPCIDAGASDGAPAIDLEGHGRPCGEGVDIGTYEFGDCPAPTDRFKRGDVDGNGELELTDPIKLLGHLFLGESVPLCMDAGDADDSGVLDLTDAVYSLSFQFVGGAPLASPFQECGSDPTLDELECQSYPGCEEG
jgi:hypothetical protein